MITVSCRLGFDKEEDREKITDLMRKTSSAVRFAYNRLLEGQGKDLIKKQLQEVFKINSRYAGDAVSRAEWVLKSTKERKTNPRKLVFGGRHLFSQLKKKHLSGKSRWKLRSEWRDKRQGSLYSRGDKSKKGNLNTRFEIRDGKLFLRINVGNRDYVYAEVFRKVQRGRVDRDKWNLLMEKLIISEHTKNYFPYTVEIRKRGNKFYAYISFQEDIPEVGITSRDGVIGIDINASPFHIAYAEVSRDGNLKSYGRFPLHVFDMNQSERESFLWVTAHQIIELAKSKNKAIVVENLKRMPKGSRGDGMKKLRKRLHRFAYKKLLQRIEILAKRNSVQVIRVNPAYTSVIGQLKYSPQLGINKDVSGAYVIGRRGLGFIDVLPKNYLKTLSDREFLNYSIERLRMEKQRLQTKLKKEKNKWKKNAIKSQLKKISFDLKLAEETLLKSLGSNPTTQNQTSGWNKSVRGLPFGRQKSWRVLKAVLTYPLLGESFVRDFSPLKPLLVEGIWERMAKRRVPTPGVGTTKTPQNTAWWGIEESSMAEYKYPTQNCTNV